MSYEKAKHNLTKILKRDYGRKALEDLTGVKIEPITEEQAQQQEKLPIVACLVPCYHNSEPMMRSAFAAMVRHMQGKAMVYSGPEIQGSSVIHWARNMLIAELLKTKQPWTHVLFMDDDIVPPPDALEKLLSHKKDIVAAVCTRRADPPVPNIRHTYEKDGNVWFKCIEQWPEDQLIEVGAVGTGMILISRHALEQIGEVYFQALYEKEVFGISDEIALKLKEARLKHFGKTANAFWFRFLGGVNGCDEYGEDISFCMVAKRYCDIPVFVDTSVQPGHIGHYPFSVQDFIAHRDAIKANRESGSYTIDETDSKLKISICVPTRGRPENIKRLLTSLVDTCVALPELILYIDDDDYSFDGSMLTELKWIHFVRGPRRTLSDCWNECAKVATGDILMVGSDDIVFKTKDWDRMVINTFESHPDKFILVHGNDGHWGKEFGTHPFIHRKWYETLGYLLPNGFAADFGDTWLNDIANLLGRRVYLNFLTEHMHPLWGKAEWDKTHQERLARMDGMKDKFLATAEERKADARKIKAKVEELIPVG